LEIRYNEEKGGPELAIEDGGVHSVEGFLLARYFMFLEVYYHKTRRILDTHLTEFLESLYDKGYPSRIECFLQLSDHGVLKSLLEREEEESAKRVISREHFRLAFETTDHPKPEEITLFDWLREKVVDKFGKEIVRFDTAAKAPYNFEQPPILVSWRKRYYSLKDRSPLIANLKKIQKMRIYARKDYREEVSEFCEDFWHTKGRGA